MAENKIKKAEFQRDSGKKKLDVERKIKEIEVSKMPDEQKKEYIARLRTDEKRDQPNQMDLASYASVRGLEAGLMAALKASPAIKQNPLATIEEWDKICQEF